MIQKLGAYKFKTDTKLRGIVYMVKMRKVFNVYNDWLLQISRCQGDWLK